MARASSNITIVEQIRSAAAFIGRPRCSLAAMPTPLLGALAPCRKPDLLHDIYNAFWMICLQSVFATQLVAKPVQITNGRVTLEVEAWDRELAGDRVWQSRKLMTIKGCALENGKAQGELKSLRAEMPEHGHGMPTKPKIRQTKSGCFEIDGVKLFMVGLWRLTYQLRLGRDEVALIQEFKVTD